MACRGLLIYALGGGFGHLTRACALARAATSDFRVRILSNSPYVSCVTRAMPELDIGAWDGIIDADCLVVDTFPRGLIGELADVIPTYAGLKVLVQRDLNPNYATRYHLKSFVARNFDLVVVPGDATSDSVGPFPQTVVTPPWLIRTQNELLSRDTARDVLGLRDDRRCILVCAAGNAEELGWYGAVTAQLVDRAPECDVRCIAPTCPDGCPRQCWVAYWPAIDLYAAADVVIGGGGYNTVYETAACGVPLVARAWPRKYDRQHLRARHAARIVDDAHAAVRSALDLLQTGSPHKRRLQFENGAAEAMRIIASYSRS